MAGTGGACTQPARPASTAAVTAVQPAHGRGGPQPPPPGVSITNTSPGLHLRRADVVERFDPAVGAFDVVDARRAGQPAGQAEGAVVPAVAQDRGLHRLEEAHAAHAAVAATPAAGAARAGANGITVQPHRKAELQHLRVGEARIGHVRLHDAGAVEAFGPAPVPPEMVS